MKKKFRRPSVADVVRRAIARRDLLDKTGRKKGSIWIGGPVKVGEENWACPIHVSGLGIRGVHLAFGSDSLDALLVVFIALRTLLQQWDGRLHWMGGDHGDIGIPAIVTGGYSRQINRELERTLDREVIRLNQALLSANKRRRPKKG